MILTEAIRKDRTSLLIALIAIAINAFIYIAILSHNPTYLGDYQLNSNPDAIHFVELARNIYERGVFSRQTEHPYTPCGVRQPAYPLIMGFWFEAFGTVGVYALNIICQILTAVSIYSLCRPIFGNKIATIAGTMVAADLGLAISNFEAMSEPLFCLIASVGVLLWLREMATPGSRTTSQMIAIGMLIGLATMVRPTSLYLPIVLCMSGSFASLYWKNVLPIRQSMIVAVVATCSSIPWIARNYTTFGLAVVSTTDASNLVYAAGASAHSLELGITIEQARERISKEFDLATQEESNNHWISDRSLKTIYDQQDAVKKQILWRYPKSLVLSSIQGSLKATISHNVGLLAHMCNLPWTGPGLTKIAKGETSQIKTTLNTNSPILVFIFLWEITITALVIIGGIAGVASGTLNSGYRIPSLMLCLVAAYYYLTIAVVGYAAYFRHRHMLIPLLYIFAAVGIFAAISQIKSIQRRSIDTPHN